MEYINPENDKYKIINLLFSCDQINFDLGYILSKNVKEIEVDDIDIYFVTHRGQNFGTYYDTKRHLYFYKQKYYFSIHNTPK